MVVVFLSSNDAVVYNFSLRMCPLDLCVCVCFAHYGWLYLLVDVYSMVLKVANPSLATTKKQQELILFLTLFVAVLHFSPSKYDDML